VPVTAADELHRVQHAGAVPARRDDAAQGAGELADDPRGLVALAAVGDVRHSGAVAGVAWTVVPRHRRDHVAAGGVWRGDLERERGGGGVGGAEFGGGVGALWRRNGGDLLGGAVLRVGGREGGGAGGGQAR